MGNAFSPGLKVLAATTLRRERRLPIAGDVLVSMGARVTAEHVVMRTELPGPADMMNIISMLGILPGELPRFMVKKEGAQVEKGELVAESKGLFGLFKTRVESSMTGTIEAISPVTGQVTLRGLPVPVEVTAYVDGVVVERIEKESVTIETTGTFIQGIFGIGGEAIGTIAMATQAAHEELKPEHLTAQHAGCIVVGGAFASFATVQHARAVGVRALIVGGIDDADLKRMLGYELGVAITGHETLGITLIITEGFGTIPMAGKTFELLRACAGMKASVNGRTQIRAGVMRPEIIVARPATHAVDERTTRLLLDLGTRVRAIREPYFGMLGVVSALPVEPVELPTESKARVVAVTFDDGTAATMPRANVEVIATL